MFLLVNVLIICVEWADVVLDLTQIGPLLTKVCAKMIYTFSFPVTLTFCISQLLMSLQQILSFYGFPTSSKSKEQVRRRDGQGAMFNVARYGGPLTSREM